MPDVMTPIDQILARAQLLYLREQLDESDVTLAEEARTIIYALAPHVAQVTTLNAELCGIVFEQTEMITRLTDTVNRLTEQVNRLADRLIQLKTPTA